MGAVEGAVGKRCSDGSMGQRSGPCVVGDGGSNAGCVGQGSGVHEGCGQGGVASVVH